MEVKGRLQGPETPPLLSLYLSSDFVKGGGARLLEPGGQDSYNFPPSFCASLVLWFGCVPRAHTLGLLSPVWQWEEEAAITEWVDAVIEGG